MASSYGRKFQLHFCDLTTRVQPELKHWSVEFSCCATRGPPFGLGQAGVQVVEANALSVKWLLDSEALGSIYVILQFGGLHAALRSSNSFDALGIGLRVSSRHAE